MRRGALEREQLAHQGARAVAVVLCDDGNRALAQLFDGSKTREPDRFLGGDDEQRQRREDCQTEAEPAQPLVARKQIFDEPRHSEAKPERDKAPECGPEQRAPCKLLLRRGRCLEHRRQCRDVRLRADHDVPAATRPCALALVRGRKHHLRVVEPERARPPLLTMVAHFSRSPSRNCNARSRRM